MGLRREVLVAVAVVLTALPSVAVAGIVDFAVGAYGGTNVPLDGDGSAGTVVGAKVRVLPPLPMIGVDVYYAHFGYEDPDEVYAQGDWALAVEGDGFDLFGADVLVGGVRGVPGFKWYGFVGINAANFEEFGKDREERKLGGEFGLGLEVVPPALGLGIEARGTVLMLGWSEDKDDKISTLTIGANYYF